MYLYVCLYVGMHVYMCVRAHECACVCICVSVRVHVSVCVCVAVQRGQSKHGIPRVEDPGGCEPPEMGTENHIWVICVSRVHFQPLTHLSSHRYV